jgi:uncharacterized protein
VTIDVHVAIAPVASATAAAAFYARLLGESAVEPRDGYAYVRVPSGLRLAVVERAALLRTFGDVPFGPAAFAFNVATAAGVDASFKAFLAAGGTAVVAPRGRSNGGRVATVADPDGNMFEIAWSETTTFDARGGVASYGERRKGSDAG